MGSQGSCMTECNDKTDSGGGRKRRRGFLKNRDGATVVEFALLAMPFILLIFAIIESCISFAAQEVMQNAADDYGRQFRTGKIQIGTLTQTEFRQKICDRIEVFVGEGCLAGTHLKIDLRSFTTFQQAADAVANIDKNDELSVSGGFKYEPGRSQSINMLRLYYEWPVMTDILRTQMSDLKKKRYTLHFAAAVWQNEPYPE